MVDTEPFFMRGSATGCLLIHGLSGNPSDLRPLADQLVTRGFTVDVPLLPGHGPTPEGSGPATWHDWRQTVADRHDLLAGICERVVLIGHSMGGALAIVEAERRLPSGLVLMGVPTFVGDWRARLLPVAKYVIPWWYPMAGADFTDPAVRERVLQASPDADLSDLRLQKQIRQSIRIPTAAIDHFFRLTRQARRLIPLMQAPTLILHGRRDSTAVPACAEEIYAGLGSSSKELAWFEASGHQLVTGGEGPHVVERVINWIERQIVPTTST